VAAASVYIPHILLAAMAEALAMLNGLSLSITLGYSVIEAESAATMHRRAKDLQRSYCNLW
jgi:hypothetical protein